MNKVVGYIRTSTTKQNISIRKQKQSIKDYCRKEDLELFKIYPYTYHDRRVSLFSFVTFKDDVFPEKGWKTFSFEILGL